MTADALSVGGLSVSRETFGKLQAFEALVRKWTPAINLVSKSSVQDLWDRHIVDSAQLFTACPPDARIWVDLGSGGGFPGLVVAILAQEAKPELRVTLVESDLRKATFLRQAAASLQIDVAVLAERAESLRPLSADIISARALTSLKGLLDLANRHLKPQGVAIFPKGAKAASELAEARASWAFDVDSTPSLSEANASILVIRNIHCAND